MLTQSYVHIKQGSINHKPIKYIACMQGKKATLRWKVVFMVPYFKGRKLILTYIYMYVLLFWFVIITSRIYLRKKVLVSAFKKISKERILSNWSFWMLSSIQVKHFYRIDVSLIRKLTDDAWVSGPDLAPQKFLLSQ